MRLLKNHRLFVYLFLLLAVQSCDLFDKKEEVIQDKYLVSYNMIRSLNKTPDIDVIFNFIKLQYPALTDINKIASESKTGVRVYKVVYNTTFKGEPKKASGIVCVPVGTGPYPLLSFQNGTNVEHSKAPSVNPTSDLFTFAEAVASTGFILVIPDYLGFGASEDMFHPYLHAESTKQAVADMLRAVKEMCVSRYIGEVLTNDLYLAGYSLGGWATLLMHKAAETEYTSEFNLVASACGAGPYDLLQINDLFLKSVVYPVPYYIGFIYNSYTKLGLITNPLTDVFKEPYATRLPTLYDGVKTGEEINAQLTSTIADLFTADYRANYATGTKYSSIRKALSDNSVAAWKTNKPVLIIHGQADTSVPFQSSQSVYAGFVAAGVTTGTVTLVPLPGLDHSSAVLPAELTSLSWLIDQRKKKSGQ